MNHINGTVSGFYRAENHVSFLYVSDNFQFLIEGSIFFIYFVRCMNGYVVLCDFKIADISNRYSGNMGFGSADIELPVIYVLLHCFP